MHSGCYWIPFEFTFLLECTELGADGFRTIVSTLTKDMHLINSALNFIVGGAFIWTFLSSEWASKHWFLAMSSNRILKYAQCYRCGRFQAATGRFRKPATHENELLSLPTKLINVPSNGWWTKINTFRIIWK